MVREVQLPPLPERTVPDDMMAMIAGAYDAAWVASLAWNRNMSGLPGWQAFLRDHGLTECYLGWARREHPKALELWEA